MIAELKQKKRLSRRKYTLYQDKVGVEIHTSSETSKYEVDIQDTGEKLHYHADSRNGRYTILTILLLIPVIVTIIFFANRSINSGQVVAAWFCSLALLFLAYLKEPVDDVYLTGGKTNLCFFRSIPTEEKVLSFIELIKTTKKEMFKKEYLAFDSDTDEDEYTDRLNWLKEQKLLTQEDYDNAKIDFEIKRLLL